MQKIIILSEFISPDQNSTGYFWYSLIKKISDKFPNSIVISPTLIRDSIKCKSIFIKKQKYTKKKLIPRIIGELNLTVKFFIQSLKHSKKNDLIISGTNPALTFFILPLLKKIKGIKYMILCHDLIPENLIPAKVLKKNSFLYKTLRLFSKYIYRNSEKVIVIGIDMKNLLIKDYLVDERKITIVRNWVNHSEIECFSKEKSIALNSIKIKENDVFVTFFGNFGRLQGIENILSSSKLITNENIKFIFIGDGYHKESIRKFIEETNSKNVILLGPIEQKDKSHGLNASDIALVTLSTGMLGLGVPSKAYFSMAANKPILAVMDEESEVAHMCSVHDIGWVCPPDSPTALARMIEEIVNQKEFLKKNNSREVLIKHYSEEKSLSDLYETIKGIL